MPHNKIEAEETGIFKGSGISPPGGGAQHHLPWECAKRTDHKEKNCFFLSLLDCVFYDNN